MKTGTLHGLLVLDKPPGITSRAAVDRALHWFPRRTRVGHTGTLDPLATGVLVLCVGVATRLTEYVQNMDKTYRTRLLLGSRSDTDDADGVVTPVAGAQAPEEKEISRQLAEFVGEIEQVPPAYSAAKVTGQRAYNLARRGQEVHLQPRRVRVYAVELLTYTWPHLELEVRCGKGTYIRSLARDLGERLGCGALVETLRRTRVGPFAADAAVSLHAAPDAVRAQLLPIAAAVADLPRLTATAAQVLRLRQGQGLPLAQVALPSGMMEAEVGIAVFGPEDALVAVVRCDRGKDVLVPLKVLVP